MKTNWKAIGIAAVSAALLYYPALKLYQYIKRGSKDGNEDNNDHHAIKAFSPAYRGKHKPHHRHPHNGQVNPDNL